MVSIGCKSGNSWIEWIGRKLGKPPATAKTQWLAGVRAMIGKGGFLQDTVDAMKEYGGVYLAIVGGAAAIETTQIEDIEQVWWEDLMPECLWKFRVKDFGPLVVAIDSHGNSLYRKIKEEAAERIKAMGLV